MSELNKRISRVLSVGLLLSVVLLLIGAVLTVTRPGFAAVHKTSIAHMFGAMAALEPGGFFDLGLVVLLANPIARVVALTVGFAQRRLWLFSLASFVVLVVLGLSIYIGLVA
jgi:uncharacterized membrane protein